MGYNHLMLITLAVSALGLFAFLFLFWKRLKEDYAGEIIFRSASYILVGSAVGWGIAVNFSPGWFFWAWIAGGLLGLLFAVLRFRVKFYETLEAFIISFLPWLALVFLRDSGARSSFSSFLAFIVILIMLFISYYLDTHYKGFTWYRSGKIGFAGLTVAVIFFLIRTAIAMTKVTVISFVGQGEALISGITALVSFLLLFNLARVKK